MIADDEQVQQVARALFIAAALHAADPARDWDELRVGQPIPAHYRRLARALKDQGLLAAMTADDELVERETLLTVLDQPVHASMVTHDPRDGTCRACPIPLHESDPSDIADGILAAGFHLAALDTPRTVSAEDEARIGARYLREAAYSGDYGTFAQSALLRRAEAFDSGEGAGFAIEGVAKVIAQAAIDWVDTETNGHEHDLECTNWGAYLDDAHEALRAVGLKPKPTEPAPELWPGVNDALDRLTIRPGGEA